MFAAYRGFRNAPRVNNDHMQFLVNFVHLCISTSFQGQYRRLMGSIESIKLRAPRTGGRKCSIQ